LLRRQKLPPSAAGKNVWKHHFNEICAFERHISRNGKLVLKFHLRICKEEQRKSFSRAD
jgi:polyphosphate kinase 2 (PPK2 family)